MIEVFKTNVKSSSQSSLIVLELLYHYPEASISFDLDDCDRILRVVAENVSCHKVLDVLQRNGYHAEVLAE